MRGSGHGPEGPDIEPGSYDTTSLRARGAIAAALNPCASLIDAAQMRPEVCVGASVADIHSHDLLARVLRTMDPKPWRIGNSKPLFGSDK